MKTDTLEGRPEAPATASAPGRALVKGPIATPSVVATPKPTEAKIAGSQSDEPKGALDQIRQDLDNVGKALNPFRW